MISAYSEVPVKIDSSPIHNNLSLFQPDFENPFDPTPKITGNNPIRNLTEKTVGSSAKVLVVHDDKLDLDSIEVLSDRLAVDIFKTNDLAAALSILELCKVDLVLLDNDMSGMDGLEFCRHLKSRTRTAETPIFLLGENLGLEKKLKGIEAGVADFITKPLLLQELKAKVKIHLELNLLRTRMEVRVEERITQLSRAEELARKKSEKLQQTMHRVIQTMAMTVETRDSHTAGHQRRVAELSKAIAIELGLAEEAIKGLYSAAKIHDLGKITIPAEILTKPGKLSESEYGLIKLHPEAGASIVEDTDSPWPLARMILEHHERIDGSGYPRGLSGDQLLLESRILAVADVVEALTSSRAYRQPFGFEIALYEIETNRGGLYDEKAVDACLKLFREKGFRWK
ncbi:MAG: HD domain-containing phosphohydrolase [Thermodesulfobacteriota bacterium]